MKTMINQQFALRAAQLLAIALAFSGSVSAQYWEQLPDMPTGNYGGYNGASLVMGGLTGSGTLTENDSVYRFVELPIPSHWLSGLASPGPGPRFGSFIFLGSFGIDVVGGMSADSSAYYADHWRMPSAPWIELSPFPGVGRAWACGANMAETIYYGLGNNNTQNDWWTYNTTQDAWTQLSSMPGPARQGASCFAVNNKVYVGLGASDLSDTSAIFYNDWYRYDPDLDTWTAIPSMPGPARMQAVSFTYSDIGYVYCGAGWDQGNKALFRDGYAYDWLNNQWLTLSQFPGEPMCGGAASWSPTLTEYGNFHVGLGGIELNGPGWRPTETSSQWWRYVAGGIASIEDLRESNTFFARTNGNELIATWSPCEGNVELRLVDALGRQLQVPLRVSGRSGTVALPISDIASGIVLVEWRAEDQRAVRRVLVE